MLHMIPLGSVQITDRFWNEEQQLVRDVVIPYQWETLNDRVTDAEHSYCIRNFRVAAGELKCEHGGALFQDSDLYKWLEAVGYCLTLKRDEQLEALADSAIELLESAQEPDGYLDTFNIIKTPGKRWQNLMEGHELYCAGHLIEGAVAYWQATGKARILDVATRFADCIDRTFGAEEGKLHGYPGHPEIELALIKLYQATKEKRYLSLAAYFINARGTGDESWFQAERRQKDYLQIWRSINEPIDLDYFQAHMPVRDQETAAGHAVRAMYLYSAMADIARIDGDEQLANACRALYRNTFGRQMYVTGGIGSASNGERFTSDFDLPNDTAYAETCASIGLMLFSQRMFMLDGDMRYYDAWERALYNTVLAGMGRDGRHFFYVNPLSVIPEINRQSPTLAHVKTVRQAWFGCACCPPNVARTLTSLGGSLYAMDDDKLYVLAHIASRFEEGGVCCTLTNDGNEYTLTLSAPKLDIILRKPEGYALTGGETIRHPGGTAVYRYTLAPLTRVMYADPRSYHNAGKVCVMRGESVYCLEEADNGKQLGALWLDAGAPIEEVRLDFLPDSMVALRAKGFRALPFDDGALYSEHKPVYKPVTLTFVPYSQWNNRGEGEMTVWVGCMR